MLKEKHEELKLATNYSDDAKLTLSINLLSLLLLFLIKYFCEKATKDSK